MADYTVRQGDDFSIADTLEDAAGNPVNLQGASIKLTLIPIAGGTALLNAVAATLDQVGDGSDGTKGKVHYNGGGATTATAGLYLGSWTVLFGGTSPQTYPNGGYILFEITADAPVTAGVRFAESTDLQARLGLVFTADEHIRAEQLLTLATGLIQQETRQTISLVTAESLTRPGDYNDRIRLPQRPVNSVTSVTLNGVLLDTSSYYIDGDELVRINWTAIQESSFGRPWSGWGFPWQPLVIVYTHGYATIPALVKTVCMEAVKRAWVNPGSVIQETIAGQTTTYAPYSDPPAGLLLTNAEKRSLNALLRRHAGSITLR